MFFTSIIVLFISLVLFTLLFAVIQLLLCRDASIHFNGIQKEHDETLSQALGNRLYFVAISCTTTGFGDITPKSALCRCITTFQIYALFVCVIAVAFFPIDNLLEKIITVIEQKNEILHQNLIQHRVLCINDGFKKKR